MSEKLRHLFTGVFREAKNIWIFLLDVQQNLKLQLCKLTSSKEKDWWLLEELC